MHRKAIALAVTLFVWLVASRAAAEPDAGPPPAETLHLKSSSTCTTAKGNVAALPPGYFIPEPLFTSLDAEVKRLQTVETRLTAENTSLKATAGPGFGWGTLVALAIGVAAGIAAAHYAF